MDDAAVFSMMAQCFGPTDETLWDELTESASWEQFLDSVRVLLQDEHPLGETAHRSISLTDRAPLQEFLSPRTVDALFNPPSYEAHRSFAAQHFTGGLPVSAVPVESLYRQPHPSDGSPAGGEYLGDAAHYMEFLFTQLGLEVPPQFAACPDHLALELDLLAVMLRSSMNRQAEVFFLERFDWLTEYRRRLVDLGSDADFYVGLIDVITGIRAQQESFCESSSFEYTADSVA